MLKFSEIFEFSKEKFRKIPILKEFEWFEWFEWFGPSPIEPFNSGPVRRERAGGVPRPPRPGPALRRAACGSTERTSTGAITKSERTPCQELELELYLFSK